MQTEREHGAEPSTQPRSADAKVTDSGWKPAGTGPPGGPPSVVDVDGPEVVLAPVVVVGDEVVVEDRERAAG